MSVQKIIVLKNNLLNSVTEFHYILFLYSYSQKCQYKKVMFYKKWSSKFCFKILLNLIGRFYTVGVKKYQYMDILINTNNLMTNITELNYMLSVVFIRLQS